MKWNYFFAAALGAFGALSGLAFGADAATDAPSPALKSTIDNCATCHGAKGSSVSPSFPNLAAQQASYIELQLKAFKDQSRADPDAQAYMWGMASLLSETSVSALASYFAAQPAAPGKGSNSALIAQGKRVFEEGVPARQIQPCATCHGAH